MLANHDSDTPYGAGIGTLALVTTTIFGFVTAITMVGPLLVDLSREFDVPVGQVGLLASAISLPWALGAPFTGLLSDRLGRRPLIVTALAGIGLSSAGAALAPDLWWLMGMRFLAGVFGAFGPASMMAAVGDLFPPHRRGMAMSWLNMGFGLAAVAGVPLVGVIDGVFGWRWSFAAVAGVLLLLAAAVQIGFPAARGASSGASVLATFDAVRRVPLLPNVLVANLMERSLFNGAALYLPPFLMITYGLSAVEVAPALSLVAFGTIAGNLLGGWLGDRFPKPLIFMVAQVIAGGIAVLLFGLPTTLSASTLVAAVFGLASTSSRPAFLALSSELSIRHRGAVLGLFSLTNQGGTAIGSAIGGLLISVGGYATFGAAGAVGAALAAVLAIPLTRRGLSAPDEQQAW